MAEEMIFGKMSATGKFMAELEHAYASQRQKTLRSYPCKDKILAILSLKLIANQFLPSKPLVVGLT
jgi:hypothetical protein